MSRTRPLVDTTPLDLAKVLYEPGQAVPAIHFPLSGVISVVTDLGDGTVVEAATIGNEGMSGISVFLGAGAPTERATVQVAGHAIVFDAAAFQRAARWLLTTADRMPSPTFELTQHFLAQMLSVRRASVSQVASTLAAQGAIRYVRGTITILDRPQLLTHTCSCYQVLRDATQRALETLQRTDPSQPITRDRVGGATQLH